MYHKILVPLDGSERAEKILPHVEKLAVGYKAEVLLLRVVQTIIIDDGYKNFLQEESLAITEQVLRDSEIYLNDVAGRLRDKGCSVHVLTRTGPVVRVILDTALKENADLIAMASHGRSGIGRVFYGSVAAGVVQHIDRPLLIIRSRDGE